MKLQNLFFYLFGRESDCSYFQPLICYDSSVTWANKKKIINDPVYGFIHIPSEILFDLIEHSYFQRLRRIKQLGLTNFVYPGATHTRFQHALGCLHLMGLAIQVIRSKGIEITDDEAEAVSAAILLHDIGHGPFSHALEFSIIKRITHEDLSRLYLEFFNTLLEGRLNMAIQIFGNNYRKKFLNQLVASQLDMDRLDYLRRDSFFTGVTEGVIGSDRIIKMLNVADDQLVVESKGIYSIEKFLIARRLMFWQVYLHKTVLAAEQLLVKILKRAKELAHQKKELFATPSLRFFLYNDVTREKLFSSTPEFDARMVLDHFSKLDDNDIITAAKVWSDHEDLALSFLCKAMLNRELFRIEIQNEPFNMDYIDRIRKRIREEMKVQDETMDYFLFTDSVSNYAYLPDEPQIKILGKDNKLTDIAQASDMLNISVLAKTVRKYFLCYPKNIRVQ